MPLVGPPIMKKIVSTFSFLKQRAISCSPLTIAISMKHSWLDLLVGMVGPTPEPLCQGYRAKMKIACVYALHRTLSLTPARRCNNCWSVRQYCEVVNSKGAKE